MLAITSIFIFISGYLFVSAFVEQYQHVMDLFGVVDPNAKWELVVNDVFYDNALTISGVYLFFIVLLFVVVF